MKKASVQSVYLDVEKLRLSSCLMSVLSLWSWGIVLWGPSPSRNWNPRMRFRYLLSFLKHEEFSILFIFCYQVKRNITKVRHAVTEYLWVMTKNTHLIREDVWLQNATHRLQVLNGR